MGINLSHIVTIKELQQIDFGHLSSYILNDDCKFVADNKTAGSVRELIHITNILTSLKINYCVDENYNITILL